MGFRWENHFSDPPCEKLKIESKEVRNHYLPLILADRYGPFILVDKFGFGYITIGIRSGDTHDICFKSRKTYDLRWAG